MPTTGPTWRQSQFWQLSSISADKILDKKANIEGKLVKLACLSCDPIKLHELSPGDVPGPRSLPRPFLVRLVLDLSPLSASISHLDPWATALELARRSTRITQQVLKRPSGFGTLASF